ncbi:MAG: tRNA pseudouridine synthase A, partial [Candidatus Eisenbacteria bacterium]|nr:tRNA pseudouridine synthase A [Candidatus Eisenbacteria bacterium]
LRTVQGVLESALDGLPLAERSSLAGAGRTDAGVHARGQVASFTARTTLPAIALAPSLNRHLPGDVRVVDAAETATGFHARHSAVARRYEYRVLAREDVMESRFAWHPRFVLPPADALERAVRPLEGEHDFTAFQASGGPPVRLRCRMMRAGWTTWESGVKLVVLADHFLYHMVRNMVGTTLAAAAAPDPAAAMRRVLLSRDRRNAGITAPACGLSLEQVFYEPGALP